MKYLVINGVQYGPGDAEICLIKTAAGKREYNRRKEVMWIRQLGRCAICRRMIELAEGQFGHSRSRGLGGGFRNDKLWDKDGKPMNAFLCGVCNTKQGSRAYEWRDNRFVPVEREA